MCGLAPKAAKAEGNGGQEGKKGQAKGEASEGFECAFHRETPKAFRASSAALRQESAICAASRG